MFWEESLCGHWGFQVVHDLTCPSQCGERSDTIWDLPGTALITIPMTLWGCSLLCSLFSPPSQGPPHLLQGTEKGLPPSYPPSLVGSGTLSYSQKQRDALCKSNNRSNQTQHQSSVFPTLGFSVLFQRWGWGGGGEDHA